MSQTEIIFGFKMDFPRQAINYISQVIKPVAYFSICLSRSNQQTLSANTQHLFLGHYIYLL